jgi:hypothetical protein
MLFYSLVALQICKLQQSNAESYIGNRLILLLDGCCDATVDFNYKLKAMDLKTPSPLRGEGRGGGEDCVHYRKKGLLIKEPHKIVDLKV